MKAETVIEWDVEQAEIANMLNAEYVKERSGVEVSPVTLPSINASFSKRKELRKAGKTPNLLMTMLLSFSTLKWLTNHILHETRKSWQTSNTPLSTYSHKTAYNRLNGGELQSN